MKRGTMQLETKKQTTSKPAGTCGAHLGKTQSGGYLFEYTRRDGRQIIMSVPGRD